MTGSVSAPSRAHRDDTRRRAALARKQKEKAERIGWATSLTTAHEEIAGLKEVNGGWWVVVAAMQRMSVMGDHAGLNSEAERALSVLTYPAHIAAVREFWRTQQALKNERAAALADFRKDRPHD